MSNRNNIIDANIAVHTAAADRYKEEPHYRPENRARVRDMLASIQKATNGSKLWDPLESTCRHASLSIL